MTADVVNLRTRRKQASRADARQAGTEAAARHGRTKAERLREQAERVKAERDHAGHLRQPPITDD